MYIYMLFALKCLALLLTHYRCIWEQSVITAGQTTRGLLYKWAIVLLRVALMASQTVCHLRAEPKRKGLIWSHCHWLRLRYSKRSAQLTVWFDCDFFGKVEQIFFSKFASAPFRSHMTWQMSDDRCDSCRCCCWSSPDQLIPAWSAGRLPVCFPPY